MNKNNRLFLAENLNKPLDENLEFSLDKSEDIRSKNIRGEITRIDDTGNDDTRGDEKSKKPKKPKKLKFKDYKKNTIKSLNEVEFFLNNLDKAFKCVHIFKIFR